MSEAKVTEGKSAPYSVGGGAPASEQIASLGRKAGHCKRLLALKMKNALTPNNSLSLCWRI